MAQAAFQIPIVQFQLVPIGVAEIERGAFACVCLPKGRVRCNPFCILGVVIGREGDVCVVSALGDVGADVEAQPEVP